MICEVGRDLTKEILERYDGKLHEERNKSEFRDKGCRRSTIKTAYGEVSYDRHGYQVRGIKESLRGLRLCTKKTLARLP